MPPKNKRARPSIEAATKGREALKKARTHLKTENGGTTESGETVHSSTAIGSVAMVRLRK